MPHEGKETHIGHFAYVIHHVGLADIVALLQLGIYTCHRGFFLLRCELGAAHNQLKRMVVRDIFKQTIKKNRQPIFIGV